MFLISQCDINFSSCDSFCFRFLIMPIWFIKLYFPTPFFKIFSCFCTEYATFKKVSVSEKSLKIWKYLTKLKYCTNLWSKHLSVNEFESYKFSNITFAIFPVSPTEFKLFTFLVRIVKLWILMIKKICKYFYNNLDLMIIDMLRYSFHVSRVYKVNYCCWNLWLNNIPKSKKLLKSGIAVVLSIPY